jgi:hypothetical protein
VTDTVGEAAQDGNPLGGLLYADMVRNGYPSVSTAPTAVLGMDNGSGWAHSGFARMLCVLLGSWDLPLIAWSVDVLCRLQGPWPLLRHWRTDFFATGVDAWD